ncbi:GTPase Obg [Striga asiatica]|uniref:GTPase Obg n=1 Tax=Striga asiatica TaxID=4170 RepID=A0A5A7R3K0_STRAF|nr:GTPase Obg [Striga asiatica]
MPTKSGNPESTHRRFILQTPDPGLIVLDSFPLVFTPTLFPILYQATTASFVRVSRRASPLNRWPASGLGRFCGLLPYSATIRMDPKRDDVGTDQKYGHTFGGRHEILKIPMAFSIMLVFRHILQENKGAITSYGLRVVMEAMAVPASDEAVTFDEANLMVGMAEEVNAKRGGHGASKNMIGTRGPDKVVLVPVGTVIHLLEGVIPSSSIEKKPSGSLDPWDIPGSLDSNSSDNFQQSLTDNIPKRPKADNSQQISSRSSRRPLKEPPFTSHSQVSPRFSTYKPQTEPAPDWQPHEYSAWEDTDNETNISETNFEEFSEETEQKQVQYDVAELTKPGERITVAQGGDGGLGNMHFTKGSKADDNNDLGHDEPNYNEANIGQPGSESVLLLELKSIADVGLVGMPNAGKSTLLGALSRAKPVIGHYAFTTLRPNLGKMNYDDLSITVADIPGLISGAHENRGLGHAFLRHIERTKVVAYVLDLSAGLEGRKGGPPWVQLRELMMELEFYREGLSARPALVVANKIDEEGAEGVFEELKERVSGANVFPVCAVLEEGVPELRDGLRRLVNGEDESRIDFGSIVVD